MSSSVEVVVRLRPLNEKEKKHGTLPVISASTNDKTVTVIKGQGSRQARSSYSFDDVYTAFSTQEEVFDATIKPMIRDVLLGYESTVFAYGQTGTGKTHTMEGDLSHPETHGVIPRAAQAIFKAMKNPEYQSYTVTCSYLEIYNEELCDLLTDHLSKKTPKLEIMEGKNGPFCRGLSEKQVQSAENVLDLMTKAQKHRKVGETNMNKNSSRSHCIFTIRIETKRKVPDGSFLESTGKLHMVDLAGSECARTANFEKDCPDQAARERERLNINRSLLTLGRVVSMLKEQSTSKKKSSNVRIPYRDSKLTRILQESLGGRCKTCIIATLSPSVTAIEESISTLNYAQAANGIINKPVSSSYMTHTSASITLNEKSDGGAESEVERWQDMECRLAYMQSQVSEAQAALARKHLQQQELVEKTEKAEASRLEAEKRYSEATVEISSLKQEIVEYVARNEAITKKLSQAKATLKKTAVILEVTQQTEVKLTTEASALICALQQSIADGDEMHQLILENRDGDIERRRAAKAFNGGLAEILEQILTLLSNAVAQEESYQSKLTQYGNAAHTSNLNFLEASVEAVRSLYQNVTSTFLDLKATVENDNGLLLSLAATSSRILDTVTKTEKLAADGESELVNSCKLVQKQLADYTTHLNQLEAEYSQSSSNLLKALDRSVLGAKKQLTQVLSSASDALAQARMDSTQTRTSMESILNAWKQSSDESTKKVEQLSKAQNNSVKETMLVLTNEMKRHDDMQNQVSKQRLHLGEKGSSHLKDLSKEQELLSLQNKSFSESYQRQKGFCEQFVKNVMTGMEQLVNQQMRILTNEQDKNYSSFADRNARLVSMNSTASESAKNIFDEVQSTNAFLKENIEAVKTNDTEVCKFLKETSSVLNDISDVSNKQKSKTQELFSKTTKGMQDLETVDTNIGRISETLQQGGEDCGSNLLECILEKSKEAVKNLSSAGKDAFSFSVNEVIATSNSAISSMETTEKEVTSLLKDKCAQLRRCVEDEKREIQRIASEQLDLAETLNSQARDRKKDFVGGVAELYRSEINQQKVLLMQTAEEHKTQALEHLSESKTQASLAKEQAKDFAINVIHAEEEVVPAPERRVPEYSDHLSSTPSDEDILRNVTMEEPTRLEESVNDEDAESDKDTLEESNDASGVLQARPAENIPDEPEQKPALKRTRAKGRKQPKSKRLKTHR